MLFLKKRDIDFRKVKNLPNFYTTQIPLQSVSSMLLGFLPLLEIKISVKKMRELELDYILKVQINSMFLGSDTMFVISRCKCVKLILLANFEGCLYLMPAGLQ